MAAVRMLAYGAIIFYPKKSVGCILDFSLISRHIFSNTLSISDSMIWKAVVSDHFIGMSGEDKLNRGGDSPRNCELLSEITPSNS